MPGSGTHTFREPDQYEANLRRAQIELTIACRGQFKARLTWAELDHLQVLRGEEDLPRVGFVCLRPELCFVTLPAAPGPWPVWSGIKLRPNEILFHGCGERSHQSTPASFVWNVIAIDPVQLEHYGRALSGKPFHWPPTNILRPSPRDAARLKRLHAQICRLAETKPRILSHSEVAHGIEQDLIQALITCLAARVRAHDLGNREHIRFLIRLEEVLADHLSDPLLDMTRLCELTGITERGLRSYCVEFLGMTPTRYVLLRRLRQARIALRDGDPGVTEVAELARRFGFASIGRFARAYKAAFGETPATTLQRASEVRFAAR